MINYCTVCGGELRIPVSEKKRAAPMSDVRCYNDNVH